MLSGLFKKYAHTLNQCEQLQTVKRQVRQLDCRLDSMQEIEPRRILGVQIGEARMKVQFTSPGGKTFTVDYPSTDWRKGDEYVRQAASKAGVFPRGGLTP